MLIIGCDYHPSFQQIAFVDTETGELGERRLVHREEAEEFYGTLREQGLKVRDRGQRTRALVRALYESEMALFFECMPWCRSKTA